MKIAIVGVSGHAPYALDGLSRGARGLLVGLAPGSFGEDVSAFAEQCRAAGFAVPVFPDYRRMLDETAPDVVVVNPHFHDTERITSEMLQRGCHVWSDKPLAFSLEGLERLRALYAAGQARLGCMLNMRYEPAFRAAYQAVQSGTIGEVRLVHAQKSYRLGKRPEFFRRRATFGGLIPWVGIHAIDLMACMSGQRFESVFAAHSAQANSGHGELEVSASCLFRMSNEVSGTATIEYLRPAAAPTHGDDRVRVSGSLGIIEVRDDRAWVIDAHGTHDLEPDHSSSFFGDFLAEVEGTGRCLVTVEEAFDATRAALLAQESADRGEVVRF